MQLFPCYDFIRLLTRMAYETFPVQNALSPPPTLLVPNVLFGARDQDVTHLLFSFSRASASYQPYLPFFRAHKYPDMKKLTTVQCLAQLIPQ